MSNSANNKTPETSIPITDPDMKAVELLRTFLTDNNIELRLSAPKIRQIEGGGLQIEQPQIIAGFVNKSSITKN